MLQCRVIATASQSNCNMMPNECANERPGSFLPCFNRLPGMVRNSNDITILVKTINIILLTQCSVHCRCNVVFLSGSSYVHSQLWP